MSHLAPRPLAPDWQLRVTDRGGTALHGAAVLVAPGYAITCAHVVSEAVAGSGAPAGPGSAVRLDAPRGLPGWEAAATVAADGWWWEGSAPWDAAVLRLDRPAPAPPAAPGRYRVGDRVRVLGFPRAENGLWVTGRTTGTGGSRFGYVQIDVDSRAGFTVLPGFSGSGVREERGNALLGLLCEATGSGRAGWMIPMEAIPRVWPTERTAADAAANGGREALTRTAQAMTDLRTLLLPDLRLDLYVALDPRLRRRLRADQDLLSFATQLVSLAHGEYGLLDEVLALLDAREDGGAGMLRVREAAAPLLGSPPG
ncbi:trypsin-like peptidase domain-containing protein [Nocardiopsis alborubida]|uniref:Trypsin-like peptidase domain-containing protein n=1 Tax=Nocardiopsis alborubida TaxID=146802 RepID=A0A7X6RMY3_9ACTN|nr:trypsin-like peptidase domain-containing protein [Nocardiopsis alborubida]NKY96114.1 trypsin-like peptidase domain-containing protein [Nocardiopsis alborubida]